MDQQPNNLSLVWTYISSATTTYGFHVTVIKLTVEDPNLQQFWSLEKAGTGQHTTQKMDKVFLRNYQATSISQDQDGTYTARFP